MAVAKSPFLVYQDFLSPLMCENIVAAIDMYSPDYDEEGRPIRRVRRHDDAEAIIFDRLEKNIVNVEEYYDFDCKGVEKMTFEYYPEGTGNQEHTCENSNYVRKKWVRTRDRDITGILFLSDFQDQVPFDSEFEVFGGKLEFPQHRFGFNPNRGTLILYPSGPHFINTTTGILAGDLYQVRLHLSGTMPYLYNPDDFPGDFTNWFNGLT